jgi:hypothetical protein
VVAREAGDEEWQAIWQSARKIYSGYEAYARRIAGRKIHIMVLTAQLSGRAGFGHRDAIG